MKKINLLLSMLAASSLLLSACDNGDSPSEPQSSEPVPCSHVDENPADHKCDVCGDTISSCVDNNHDHLCDVCGADLPWVESLSITNKPTAEFNIGEEFELTVSVTAHNDASEAFTFSIEDEDVVSFDEFTGKFTTLAAGETTITATSTFDTTVFDSVEIIVIDKGFDANFLTKGWTFTREYPAALIKEFLGSGDSEMFVPSAQSGLMGNGVYYKKGTTHFDLAFGYANSVNNYNAVMNSIYDSGLYGIGADLTTEDNFFVDSDLTHVIRYQDVRPVFPGNSYIGLNFYKTSDLFMGSSVPTANTEWSIQDKGTFSTVFGGDYDVPFFKLAEGYTVQNYRGTALITDNSANFHLYNAISEQLADQANGWIYDSDTGFYSKDLNAKQYMMVSAMFTLEYGNFVQIGIFNKPLTEWPAQEVATFIGDGSTLTVPAATGTSFDVLVTTDSYGDTFMQISVTGGDMDDYANLFDANLFTITYNDWYEQYNIIAKDCTLDIYLIQEENVLYVLIYVIEPAPWPYDEIATFIDDRTDEVVPSITCTSVGTEILDGGFYIEVNGVSIHDYVEICVDAGYSISTIYPDELYRATSPKGSIVLNIGLGYYSDIEIEVVIVEPAELLEEWPVAQIAEALGELGAGEVGSIPAPKGEFEFKTDPSRPNECIVTVYADGTEYASYLVALAEAGFSVVSEKGIGFEADSAGGTIHINGFDYTEESEPYFILDIWAEAAGEGTNEFPAQEIASFLGFDSLTCPIPGGESFNVTKPYGDAYPAVDVEVVGGDLNAYVAALGEAGFVVSDKYSYAGAYTAYQKGGSGLVVYVYETEGRTNSDFVLGFENPLW